MGLNRNTSNEPEPGRGIGGLWMLLVRGIRRNPKRVYVVDGAIALALAFPLAVHASDARCSLACGAGVVLPHAYILETLAATDPIVR